MYLLWFRAGLGNDLFFFFFFKAIQFDQNQRHFRGAARGGGSRKADFEVGLTGPPHRLCFSRRKLTFATLRVRE